MSVKELLQEHKLDIQSKFVPLSRSRGQSSKYPTLNYRVSLVRNGKVFEEVDYTLGYGYCINAEHSTGVTPAIQEECESGVGRDGRRRMPKPEEVFASVASDTVGVFNCCHFKEWCEQLCMDDNSIHDRVLYDTAVRVGIALMAMVGWEAIQQLAQEEE